jgi:hypothetical protein
MRNEAKYLWFRSQIGKMNPTERMFVMNRICNIITNSILNLEYEQYRDTVRSMYIGMLRHFSANVRELDETWWRKLREFRSLPLFQEVMKQV